MMRSLLPGLVFLGTLIAAGLPEESVAAWIAQAGGRAVRDTAGHIIEVDMASTWVSDADLERLAGLSHLRVLNLSQTKITDVGLERLQPLKQVRSLNLRFAEFVTENGLAHITGWNGLEHLDLRGTRVTSRAFDYIARLTNLRSLDISHTYVDDDGFEHLAGLTKLEKLACGANRLTGAALPLLKLAPALVHLDVGGIQRVDSGLWGVALNDANLKSLGELTQLEALDLSGANLNDRGLDRPGHPEAERTELPDLSELAGLQNLRLLDLSRTPVTSQALEVLPKLPKLRDLRLGMASKVDDATVAVLTRLRSVESLYLTGTSITDRGLEGLGSIESLKRLSIGGTPTSGGAVERFRHAHQGCKLIWWPVEAAQASPSLTNQ